MLGMNVFSGGPCLKHIFQDVQCTCSRMNGVSGEIFVERNPPLRPAPAISNLMRSWNASLVNRTSHVHTYGSYSIIHVVFIFHQLTELRWHIVLCIHIHVL